eukprot:CAMPEP_0201565068 /NCGR_PEP_ID=MMETSP0190_2-20130828/3897_1 /ASSEMBLY_ACC=CAM_ASM_000263 /TAXON_ID=37353 /ORGANISM="Rosalina sp." /LENGTH=84 /DNA_ID=CAMNT_0047982087 /DNA_START=96 /DNA_END=350 /DNA_ORIENTATION=+
MAQKDSKDKSSKDNKNEDKKPKIIEVVFNEDDAFEEFEMDTWKVDKNTSNQEDADLWQEDWGDKDVDEAFEKILRDEIQNAAKK